jgi:hypothetical protein
MDWLMHQLFGSQFTSVKAAALVEIEQFLTTTPSASEAAVSAFIISKMDSIISPIASKVSPTFQSVFTLLANAVVSSETASLYSQAIAEIQKQAAATS